MNSAFLDDLAEAVQSFFSVADTHDADRFDEAERAYDEMLSEAEAQGMTRIGAGGGRVVFRGGRIAGSENVVKLEKRGTGENRDAVRTWQEMSAEAREHVVPLVAWADDYAWVVQRQAGAGPPGSTAEVQAVLNECGWYLNDCNLENIGSVDGEPAVLDLGRVYRL